MEYKVYLVVIRWVQETRDTICIVAETEEKAREWIDKENEGMQPSGLGFHKIIPVTLYK